MLADPNFKLQFEATKADVAKSGDIAYTQGTYSMTMSDPKTKQPVTDKGKYVTVYKKQADGSWKAVSDILNSDLPLPGPEPTR
jgi:ketosteroid isomerase-like protein